MNYRRAKSSDCPAILGLIQELALYERAPHEVINTVEGLLDTGFGAQPLWWAFVCEIDHQIVGFALYYIRYSTWKGPRMYLEDLYVQPEYRQKGIGRTFMDLLIQEAKEKHLRGISWQVLDWNEPAIAFYKKLQANFDPEWINCTLQVP